MIGFERVLRRHASTWMLLPLLALGLVPLPTRGECPPCQMPNPNYDPNHPYPDEQSEPECINAPRDVPACISEDKSCPQPDVSGEAYHDGRQWISGHVQYGPLQIEASCEEGCDGEGNKTYKAVGDVACDINIWVAKYAPVRGSPLICGFGKKERTEANIQSTIDHEMIHCESTVAVLNDLRKTLCDSSPFTSPEDCEEFIEKFRQAALKYWNCKRQRSMYHCDFTGHRGTTFDDCGNEFPGDPLTPPGNCPDCTAL